MSDNSDLPYVRSGAGRERANPVYQVDLVKWEDLSGTTPIEVFEILPAVGVDVTSRFIAHVGLTGSLWVNFLGDDAGVNAPGSLEIAPGDILAIPTRAAVSAIGTAPGIPYTAAQG